MLDFNIVWYNDVVDQKLPLELKFRRLSRQLLCHMISGKVLHSYGRDGEHPSVHISEWMCLAQLPGFA